MNYFKVNIYKITSLKSIINSLKKNFNKTVYKNILKYINVYWDAIQYTKNANHKLVKFHFPLQYKSLIIKNKYKYNKFTSKNNM